MTPTLDLPVAPPTAAKPATDLITPAAIFRHKETVLAGYLAAFAVVYYRLPAERAPAQLTATLHVETADTIFPPAAVTLQLADDRTLAEVAAEAATRLLMALADVADELGAAIGHGRLALPTPEAQTPDQTWELTVRFGTAPDEAAALSFGSTGGATAPRETTYLTEHAQAVFAQLTQNPAALVGHVFFLTEAETAQLREFRTGPPLVAEGGPQQLHHLFEQTARTYPNNVALTWLGQPCTYHELDDRADQLAAHLRQRGVQPGDFVGLLMAKSLALYVGMLAVLKAGAAYVPLDLSFPPDRVAFILEDCGARALLINNDLPEGLAAWPGQVLDLRQPVPAAPALTGPAASGPDSIAYVIYTSGTTGLPKGVLLPHHSICHLVRAEQQLFQPTPQDRVVQGFSVAFDASLEELWLAWATGAALVPVPEETMKAPDALPGFLADNQITIFSTVPTLLSLLPAAVPTLRLLILGGEVCPPELLAKWASRQCQVVNTYGPTEATVVATAADFVPGHKLTIGRPLAGYEVLILDQQGQLLPPGAAGELCIGGAALAAGYLNRPELSAAKFNTVRELTNGFSGRLYRTGDLARFEADGNIDFLGRIDTQVKIRGFRVELAEIESLLLQWPGIRNAAVALKEGADGVKKLIAYLILEPNQLLDEPAVRAYLRERLAPYMLPAALVPLAAFPLLTSGKVDRKALPYPVGGGHAVALELALPRTPTEAAIYAVWQKRFDTADLSITDDFFDLGGNSLLASLIVSELRQSPEFQGLSVKEMYTRRTIAALAAAVDAETQRAQTAPAAPELAVRPLRRASVGTRLATATLQAGAVFLFYAVPIFLLNGSLHWRGLLGGWSWETLVALVLGATLAYVPLACGLTVALKWLVIGRFRAGEYPLWGWYYLRFWLVKKLVEAAPTQLLSATPFLAVFYRLLGANIGPNVYLGTTRVMTFDLLTLHEGASLAREAGLLGYRVERDRLILGPITVGRNAYVGLRAILENDTQVGDEAGLDDLSVLPAGQHIPFREGWLGSPARRGRAVASGPWAAQSAPGAGYQVVQLLAIALMLLVPTLAATPVLGLFYEAVERWDFEPALLTLLPLSALYVVLLGGLLALIKRFAAGRQAAGTLPLHSLAYVRHWLADAVLAQSLALMKSIYATIYAPYWLRLLGAKIGPRAEISTLNHISADHLTVGAGAFLADSVSVGAPRVQHGLVTVQPTVVGERTFIGNSAVLAGGTVLGTGNLIGALSSAPPDTPADGTSWVGSPSFLLPNRPVSAAFAAEFTFAPPTRLVWARGTVEIFKIILPYTFAFLTFAILYHYTKWHLLNYPFWSSVAVGTGALVAIIMGFSLLTALLKWVLIGHYQPSEKPLWSSFVWRNELINSLCESYVYPFWEAPLLGTPFATWFFQLMGSHFGHSVYLDTTEITEFDLAWVADHAVLNNGATIQTHLFEDRIMKMSDLRIGRAATVGTSSVVLYDSVIGPGATLKSLSLLMKGEKLPAETRWQGIPSSFVSGG